MSMLQVAAIAKPGKIGMLVWGGTWHICLLATVREVRSVWLSMLVMCWRHSMGSFSILVLVLLGLAPLFLRNEYWVFWGVCV